MPPTFAYIMALAAYIAIAIVVWAICVILACIPRTRLTSAKIALGMLVSFPAVLIWQIIGFPILFVITFVLGWPLRNHLENKTAETIGILLAIILLFGGSVAVSVAGFADGWRVGWTTAVTRDFASVLKISWMYRGISALTNKMKKSKAEPERGAYG